MDRIDRRVKRTNRLLQDALIDLTLERGYEAVTIRDITDRADVGYTTFFRHYPDKESLLASVVETMKDDFQELLTPYSMASAPEKAGALLFEYVQQNLELCRVLVSSMSASSLLETAQQIGLQGMESLYQVKLDGPIPPRIAVTHLVSSLILLVRWWVENDLPYSPEQMGQITAQLVIRPVMEVLEKPLQFNGVNAA
jgi:AcrR family transcriptional regulator